MSCTTLEHALAADKSDVCLDEEWAYWRPGKYVVFDSTPTSLHEMGLVVTSDGWTIGKAEPDTQYTDVPGRAGGVDTSVEHLMDLTGFGGAPYAKRRTIEINVAALGDSLQIHEAMLRLAKRSGTTVCVSGLLEDRALYFDGRMSLSEWTPVHAAGGVLVAAKAKISINAAPYAYGPQRIVKLAEGENDVAIEGTAPTRPYVHLTRKTGSTAAGAVTHYNTDTHMKPALAPDDNTLGWDFDCGAPSLNRQTARDEDLTETPISMDSRWLELPGGPNRLDLSNTDGGWLGYRPAYRI